MTEKPDVRPEWVAQAIIAADNEPSGHLKKEATAAADAAVRVVLEHLRAEFSHAGIPGEDADYGHGLSKEAEAFNEAMGVAWTITTNLLNEVPDAPREKA